MKSDEPQLVKSVRSTLLRHQMIDTGDAILVGTSGGADSVSLLHVLSSLGLRLGVGHVNHGWRAAASDEDESFVRDLANRLGIPFYSERTKSPDGRGKEVAAREARHQFFNHLLAETEFTKVALAHSQDDRNETLLLNLLRGSGPEGLISMKPVSGHVIRPLIGCTRDEVESYLLEVGQDWREDETNSDLSFARNRMRHVILPKLASEFNPNLSDALARMVEILEGENSWMGATVDSWLRERCGDEGSATVLKLDGLEDHPVGFVRRVLREALRRAGSHLTDVGFDHLESMRSLLKSGKSGKVIELPGKLVVERSFDTLIFSDASEVPVDYEYDLRIPGQVLIPEIGYVIKARITTTGDTKPKPGRALADGESLGPCVRIRNWRNGDIYSPLGLHAAKLKKLFQNERIPRRQRRQWPVLVAESSIVWVASFPVSREFAPTGYSRRIIEFEASPLA